MQRTTARMRCHIAIICSIVLAMVVAILASIPTRAHADSSLNREQVFAFLQTEQAMNQTKAFLNMEPGDSSAVQASQITFPRVVKVHYVHAQSGKALADDLSDLGTFEWRAVASVDGVARGSVIVWDNNGTVVIAGYDPGTDEAAAIVAIPDDPDATFVVDRWSGEYYLVQNGVMSAANDKARARLAAPRDLAQAAKTIVEARGGDANSITADSRQGTDDLVGSPGGADSGGRWNVSSALPWIVGALVAVGAGAAVAIGSKRHAGA